MSTSESLHRALASCERPPPPGRLSACLTFGWRAMLKIKHVPEQLLDVTITPVLFLLMFTYLFGGALVGSTSEYLQYLLPGVLVQSVLFTSVYSGVSLNTDATKGVIDRFRSLPVWRPAPLVGAVLGVVAALALVIAFSSGLAWVFTTLGLILRSPTAVLNTGFMALFPLVFLSNVFVEPETLPRALEWFVDVNPVSLLVTACRGLMGGNSDAGEILVVLAVAVGLTAVFAPLTVRRYRKAG